jgi:Uma2 family endonuclease
MTLLNPNHSNQPIPQPITVQQYELLAEHRLLPVRTQLIQGVIVSMPPMSDDHVNALDDLSKRCVLRFHDRARVTSQTPLRLEAAFGEPEPDIMLCKPDSRGVAMPADVLLLVEISKSTYQSDREHKLPMYAQHQIPEVWLHNLNNNTLEVYRNPRQVSSGWVYDAPIVFKPGVTVAPLCFPEDMIVWW